MRVCFVAGREPGYQRNRVQLRALESLDVELEEIVSNASHYYQRFPRVIWRLFRERGFRPDIYYVGFLGHPLVPLLQALAGRPIVFDPFISLFDTLCNDRRRFAPSSFMGRLLFGLDRWACEGADIILLDTEAHIDFFASSFAQPRGKFRRLWVGADDRRYYPRSREDRGPGQSVEVFYYATFQPLHGVDVVLGAAELLGDDHEISLHIVGRGPELRRLQNRLDAAVGKGYCTWRPWVNEEELPLNIARADICLGGHFSTMPKASRVIPGKTYQFLAMRKPVIVGDNPANSELLTHGRDAFFVRMGDSEALAEAIRELAGDKEQRDTLAGKGYGKYRDNCTPEVLAGELENVLDEVVGIVKA
jgi:glycosyltransferase involved in cell wall biosynthesis